MEQRFVANRSHKVPVVEDEGNVFEHDWNFGLYLLRELRSIRWRLDTGHRRVKMTKTGTTNEKTKLKIHRLSGQGFTPTSIRSDSTRVCVCVQLNAHFGTNHHPACKVYWYAFVCTHVCTVVCEPTPGNVGRPHLHLLILCTYGCMVVTLMHTDTKCTIMTKCVKIYLLFRQP